MKFITHIPKARFNAFVKTHQKSHFAQSYEWGSFKGSPPEWDFETVGLENASGDLVAAALVLIRYLPIVKRPFLYIPRGFVIDFEDETLLKTFVEAFKTYAKSKKAIFFKIDPDLKYVDRDIGGQIRDETTKNDALITTLVHLGFKHLGFTKGFDATIQPRYTFRLNLEIDEDDLLKGLHKTTRYGVKTAQKKGVEIIEGTRDELVKFANLVEITGQRDGFLTRPLSYFEDMYDTLNPSGMCHLYLAKLNTSKALANIQKELKNTSKLVMKYEADLANALTEKRKKKIMNQLEQEQHRQKKFTASLAEFKQLHDQHPAGIIMAGGIVVRFGYKSWYLYGASDNLHREFMPSYFLQWQTICDAKKAGCDTYDFFGISGHTDEADPLYGLYHFKKGFGGEFTEFIGEFDYVIHPLLYFSWTTVLPLFKKYRNKLKKKKGLTK